MYLLLIGLDSIDIGQGLVHLIGQQGLVSVELEVLLVDLEEVAIICV